MANATKKQTPDNETNTSEKPTTLSDYDSEYTVDDESVTLSQASALLVTAAMNVDVSDVEGMDELRAEKKALGKSLDALDGQSDSILAPIRERIDEIDAQIVELDSDRLAILDDLSEALAACRLARARISADGQSAVDKYPDVFKSPEPPSEAPGKMIEGKNGSKSFRADNGARERQLVNAVYFLQKREGRSVTTEEIVNAVTSVDETLDAETYPSYVSNTLGSFAEAIRTRGAKGTKGWFFYV